MIKTKVQVGVIGAGRIGRIHAGNLIHRIAEAQVVAIADVNKQAAEKCAAELKIPEATDDAMSIMENPDIEAVIICSTSNTHCRFIEYAAEAGKHIFCEKPIDQVVANVDRALGAVAKAQVKLMVGFNRRFDANFRRIWEHIHAGKVGNPYLIKITSRDPEPPSLDFGKTSGGLFIDTTVHDFDMARFLIRSEVDEIYATAGAMVVPEIGAHGGVDTAVVMLKFENGVLGVIDNSMNAAYGYDQRVEVFGSLGMTLTTNRDPNDVSLYTLDGITKDVPSWFFIGRYETAYLREMEEFIQCVIQDHNPPVTGYDGKMALVLGIAAQLSCEENRPVKIAEFFKDNFLGGTE